MRKITDYLVKRDFYGRPWISQDGGPLRFEKGRKSPVNATAYTRVSTLAGALDDQSGLIDWSAANAAIGVVRDPAIYSQIATLASAHRDPWNVPEAKTPLKELVQRAQKVAGSESAAGLGTALHGLTEIIDNGGEPEFVPPEMRPWLDEYRRTMEPWEVLATEVFVVIDELKAAGSVDCILRHKVSGHIVCAEKKTGRNEPDYPLRVTVQLAAYAHGQRYDQKTGERLPLRVGVDLQKGLLIHIPIRTAEPRCVLYPVDLQRGWELAELSMRVREVRKMSRLVALT